MAARVRRKMNPVPLERVGIDGGFWGRRVETNRNTTIPYVYEQCKTTGRIDAFRLDWKPGDPNGPHKFWDSDVAKWLEAAAYSLATHPDRRLATLLDGVADLIASAQQADGYLNVHFTIVEPQDRWRNLRDGHELYCAGHLIEAAVAVFQATGRRRLLDVMRRYANYIGSVFGRGRDKLRGYPGHEEIELALVKLYRVTGEKRYLGLAKFFIDERGRQPHYYDIEASRRGADPNEAWYAQRYGDNVHAAMQAHLPVREQRTAEGHSVRAMYLFSAMADLAAETNDPTLLRACRTLWKNVTERRMYVTGGVGSTRPGERFTFDYDLPNDTVYAETCANVGLVFWAHRMLQIEADAQYADVMERALYNGVISGISLDGRKFFYVNPLAALPEASAKSTIHQHVRPARQEWFGCACCPPNIARLLASLGGYVYSQSGKEGYVHLYVQGRGELEIAGRKVVIEQETGYPYDETVQITVRPDKPSLFTLALRLPGWCRRPRLKVNGRSVALGAITRRGYARIRRAWQDGDTVELILPMPVERIEAHPNVRANSGRVALQRGPLVFCLEEADNGTNLNDLVLDRRTKLETTFHPRLLGGIPVITGKARRRTPDGWRGALYRPAGSRSRTVLFKAIPYFAWANRRPGEMIVWIREG